MGGLRSRIAGYLRVGRTLRKAGVSVRSILLYPIRRRLANSRDQFDLKNGVSIVSPVDERLIDLFDEVWISRCYTPAGFDLAAGDTVVDIGANVGVFTLWAASREAGVRVVAIEPSPRMSHFLRRNVSASGLGNVVVVEAAAGGKNGDAILYSRGDEALNTLYCHDIIGSKFRPLTRTQVITLDEVFDCYGVQICHLLKLDCEGAEYEILFNARQATLERIRKISMEYHIGLNEHTPDELARFLEGKGFLVVKLPLIDEEGGYLYATRFP